MKTKGTRDMVQAVDHLPSKHEALSSKPHYCPKLKSYTYYQSNKNKRYFLINKKETL
jgi:hypothetical protein